MRDVEFDGCGAEGVVGGIERVWRRGRGWGRGV